MEGCEMRFFNVLLMFSSSVFLSGCILWPWGGDVHNYNTETAPISALKKSELIIDINKASDRPEFLFSELPLNADISFSVFYTLREHIEDADLDDVKDYFSKFETHKKDGLELYFRESRGMSHYSIPIWGCYHPGGVRDSYYAMISEDIFFAQDKLVLFLNLGDGGFISLKKEADGYKFIGEVECVLLDNDLFIVCAGDNILGSFKSPKYFMLERKFLTYQDNPAKIPDKALRFSTSKILLDKNMLDDAKEIDAEEFAKKKLARMVR